MFLAILAALHFVAAPAVMAMTAPAGEKPCEHCGAGAGFAACGMTAPEPDGGDGAPMPGRYPEPDTARPVAMLAPAVVADEGSLSPSLHEADPARAIALSTGRHTGDPPLNIVFGKFLN